MIYEFEAHKWNSLIINEFNNMHVIKFIDMNADGSNFTFENEIIINEKHRWIKLHCLEWNLLFEIQMDQTSLIENDQILLMKFVCVSQMDRTLFFQNWICNLYQNITNLKTKISSFLTIMVYFEIVVFNGYFMV